MRATECRIVANTDGIVVKIDVLSTIFYAYDSEDRLSRKRIMFADGKEHVVYYETPDDSNTVAKFVIDKQTVTSHSKTDSFGRKVFDELQIGKGFVSRQFDYHIGEITEEHAEHGKIKSSPTTQLVDRIVLSDHHILSYEYDKEERITKVTDSLEGQADDVTEYTYDALGQLLTETRGGLPVNVMTYDNYGNILTKNGVTYGYEGCGWKDRLVSVGNETITYDAQGNPTTYLGKTLTWEKGRQLKSFGEHTYTYNANGIRTSKTVGTDTHEYTLDGTSILRETWGKNTLIPLYDNEESVCGIIYNDNPFYFLKNLQGDIIAIVDQEADVVARYSYDAWGVCTIVSDASQCDIANINPYRYRGYYYDAETKLYYLQSRYYDPEIGRFVCEDIPELIVINTNIYQNNLMCYCNNNPICNIDNEGTYSKTSLESQSWLFKIASAFGVNVNLTPKPIRRYIVRINVGIFKLELSISVGYTKNYKAGFAFTYSRKSISVSTNLGIGKGYSFAYSYTLGWLYLSRSMSLVYASKNDGLYVSLDIEFQINHLATAAVVAACVYAPQFYPALVKMYCKSKSAAIDAIKILIPIVQGARLLVK